MAHTRLQRVRASVGIAALALQQIQDDVTADDIDAPELASILHELSEDTDPPGGFLSSVAQLLTVAAKRAEQIEPDRDGDASCPLHEAADLITDMLRVVNAVARNMWGTTGNALPDTDDAYCATQGPCSIIRQLRAGVRPPVYRA